MITLSRQLKTFALIAILGISATTVHATEAPSSSPILSDSRSTDARYRSMNIQGIEIAYREAGDAAQPAIVLLHGFPTSSHMYRELIPQLADRYHVISPDYPGFGASDMPMVSDFEYSFENYANVVDELLQPGINCRTYQGLFGKNYGLSFRDRWD